MKTKTRISPFIAFVFLFATTSPAQAQYLEITGTTVDGQLYRGHVSPDSIELDLSNKQLTSLTLPDGMIGLETLDLSTNRLVKLTLPKSLNNLKELHLEDNPLNSLAFSEGMPNLKEFHLEDNSPLTSLTFSEISPNIKDLPISVHYNGLRERESLEALLVYVYPDDRGLLTSIALPDDLSNLEVLDINHTGLTSLNLPEGMTSLKELRIYRNELGRVHTKSSAV